MLFGVPFEANATIQVASPVGSKVIFAFHTCDEVVNILLPFIFYTKVVNH
jgi:hypothetical protein